MSATSERDVFSSAGSRSSVTSDPRARALDDSSSDEVGRVGRQNRHRRHHEPLRHPSSERRASTRTSPETRGRGCACRGGGASSSCRQPRASRRNSNVVTTTGSAALPIVLRVDSVPSARRSTNPTRWPRVKSSGHSTSQTLDTPMVASWACRTSQRGTHSGEISHTLSLRSKVLLAEHRSRGVCGRSLRHDGLRWRWRGPCPCNRSLRRRHGTWLQADDAGAERTSSPSSSQPCPCATPRRRRK